MSSAGRNRRPTGQSHKGEARPFDFRRPSKLNRDHVRTLQIVQETFARQFSTVLSSSLRAVSTVSVLAIEQFAYDEYVRSTPNPSHLSILSIQPLPGAAIMQLPLDIALTAVDLLLGGHGGLVAEERPLTDIEENLIRTITHRLLKELSYAFESVVALEPEIVTTESNPQFAQVASPSDMTVVITYEVKINAVSGMATLCLPYTSLAPVLDSFASNQVFADRSPAQLARMARVLEDRLYDVPVEVSVHFDPVPLTSGDIVRLQVGDVITLRHNVNTPVTVAVADHPTYAARPARKGRRYACEITEVLPKGFDPALRDRSIHP